MSDLVKTILRIAKIILFTGAVILLINQFVSPAITSASDDIPLLISKISNFLIVARENINMIINPYVVDAFLWIALLRPVVTLIYKFGYWLYTKITD